MPGYQRQRLRLASWLLLCLTMIVSSSHAQDTSMSLEDGGRFEVRSAYLEPVDGVLRLSGVLDLALSRAAIAALKNGVPVTLQAELVVNRKRHYLPDQGVAHLVQRWKLQYNALSEHYAVTNINSGQQTSYPSLSTALTSLSEIHAIPVLDEALTEKHQRYEGSLRLSAVIDGGLPDALRVLMFWADWVRTSEWYTWTLRI